MAAHRIKLPAPLPTKNFTWKIVYRSRISPLGQKRGVPKIPVCACKLKICTEESIIANSCEIIPCIKMERNLNENKNNCLNDNRNHAQPADERLWRK